METKKDILLLRILLQRVLLLDQKGWYYMDKWKIDIFTIIYRLGVICGVICLDIIVKNS